MNQLKNYSEDFKLKFEKFLIGCDSIEEMGLWNLDEYGEMDVFYTADLTGMIIRLIAADGNITEKEVSFLNDVFGFDYTVCELKEIYENCADNIASVFEAGAKNGLTLMRSVSEKLANAYYELIITICDIVIASDGCIDAAETDLAKQIKNWGK